MNSNQPVKNMWADSCLYYLDALSEVFLKVHDILQNFRLAQTRMISHIISDYIMIYLCLKTLSNGYSFRVDAFKDLLFLCRPFQRFILSGS